MNLKDLTSKTKNKYTELCQKTGSILKNPSNMEKRQQYMMLFFGVALLNLGLVELASAQTDFDVDETQFTAVICAITEFIEGAFGALIMVISGIGAIVSAAFGQYKAAIGLLVVAVGAFVLRSLVATFFGDEIYADCAAE